MEISRFSRVTLVCGLAVACMFALAACGGSKSGESVAATVDGDQIMEQTITDRIQMIRDQSGLAEEAEWGAFLDQNGMTPKSVREEIINSQVDEKLMVKGAKELGITVEDSEVDEYVNQMKSNYSDDAAWKSALEQAGFTEESYREVITQSLYEQKANEHFEQEASTSETDYVSAAQQYAPYYNGAKRTSHILFKVDDPSNEAAMAEARAKAESVLEQINNGLDFAEAAKQYSDDTSAQNGGDVGWDVLNSFVSEYTSAVEGLGLNQVSGLVQSDYGIHIIKVTDVYNAPEDPTTITSMDQIPAEFQENIKSMASSMNANTKYQEWIDGLKEKATIEIKDMPSGLPYDLDMSKYQSSDSSSASEEAEGEATGSEASSSSAEASNDSAEASNSSAEATNENASASSSASGAEASSSSSAAA